VKSVVVVAPAVTVALVVWDRYWLLKAISVSGLLAAGSQ
jgi:hypothetical protein